MPIIPFLIAVLVTSIAAVGSSVVSGKHEAATAQYVRLAQEASAPQTAPQGDTQATQPSAGQGVPGNVGQGYPGGYPGGQGYPQGYPGGEGGYPGGGPGGFPGGGPGGPGGFPGGGPGGFPGGDSGEFDAQCKKELARGAKMMEKQMLRGIETQLKQLTRQGIAVPAEVTADIEKLKSLIEQMKNIESCDAMSEIGPQIQETMQGLQEKLQKVSQLAFLPKMKKQITRELNAVEKAWNRAKRQAAKLDPPPDSLARGEEIFSQLKATRDEVFAAIDAALSGGDLEALETMEEKGEAAFELKEELEKIIGTLEAVANAPRQLKLVEREYKTLVNLARKLKRKGEDTAELEACAADFKTAIDEAKAATRIRPIDLDAVEDAFSAVEEAGGRCQDLEEGITGESEFDEAVGEPTQLFKPLETPDVLNQFLGGGGGGGFGPGF